MVSSKPRPHFTPGKDPVSILQEAEWAPGPAWTGGKSRPHRDSIPDRPALSQSQYRLSYPPNMTVYKDIVNKPLSVYLVGLLIILFLTFRRVLNVIYSFLGNSPAPEF